MMKRLAGNTTMHRYAQMESHIFIDKYREYKIIQYNKQSQHICTGEIGFFCTL